MDFIGGGLMGLTTDVLGTPVDLATMAMRPFGYSVSDNDVVGSSNWIASKLGARPAGSAPETAGRVLTGVLTPSPGDAAKLATLLSAAPVPAYHRFTNGSPDTGVGYMMFADDADRVRHYGKNHYTFDDSVPDQIIDSRSPEFKKALADALKRHPEKVHEYQGDVESLVSLADPENIVDSAGIWDAPDLVDIIWNDVLEPMGKLAVRTSDGAIVFDRELVKSAR